MKVIPPPTRFLFITLIIPKTTLKFIRLQVLQMGQDKA